MKCSKCQFENPQEATFCIECGNPMEFPCPKCGTPTPRIGKFCMKCGCDLRESVDAPPIDYSQPESYTPKFLADKILTTRSSIEGERKLVTVLFADVANYTSTAEKLDPEEVHQTTKSRLQLELRGMVPKDDYFFLERRCLHYGATMSHFPNLDVPKAHVNIDEEDRQNAMKGGYTNAFCISS